MVLGDILFLILCSSVVWLIIGGMLYETRNFDDKGLGLFFFWPFVLVFKWIPFGFCWVGKQTFYGVGKAGTLLRPPKIRYALVRARELTKAAFE